MTGLSTECNRSMIQRTPRDNERGIPKYHPDSPHCAFIQQQKMLASSCARHGTIVSWRFAKQWKPWTKMFLLFSLLGSCLDINNSKILFFSLGWPDIFGQYSLTWSYQLKEAKKRWKNDLATSVNTKCSIKIFSRKLDGFIIPYRKYPKLLCYVD